jgi:hypothetical protein
MDSEAKPTPEWIKKVTTTVEGKAPKRSGQQRSKGGKTNDQKPPTSSRPAQPKSAAEMQAAIANADAIAATYGPGKPVPQSSEAAAAVVEEKLKSEDARALVHRLRRYARAPVRHSTLPHACPHCLNGKTRPSTTSRFFVRCRALSLWRLLWLEAVLSNRYDLDLHLAVSDAKLREDAKRQKELEEVRLVREEMERLDALRDAHREQVQRDDEDKRAQRRLAAQAKAADRKARLHRLKHGGGSEAGGEIQEGAGDVGSEARLGGSPRTQGPVVSHCAPVCCPPHAVASWC